MHLHIYVHIHTHIFMHIHMYKHIYTHVCIHTYIHTHLHTHKYICAGTDTHKYICAGTHTHTHTHTHIYTHTHTIPVVQGYRICQLHLCREVRPLPTLSVLVMTLNCICWWGSGPGALGNMEYSFIAITPRTTLTWSGSTC